MIKKLLSILLIFTVNLFVLTHAVMPHHHHHGLPHFVLCEEAHEHPDDGAADNCCSPDEKNETCTFEQHIDIVYELKEDCSRILCTSHHHPDLLLQAVLFSFTTDFSLAPERISSEKPLYLISYYFDYAGSGLGLRAPPMV
jgi:hypothetical protein